MAIQWGQSVTYGPNSMRVGIDVTSTAVAWTSSDVTFTMKVYTQNTAGPPSGLFGLDLSLGSSTQAVTFDNQEAVGAVVYRKAITYTFTYLASSYGYSPGTIAARATSQGMSLRVDAVAAADVSIPIRPFGPPAAPTAITTSRTSDTSMAIGWTNNPTTSSPYGNIEVWRADNGTASSTSRSIVATLPGTATSYSDTTTVANSKYQYWVRATNSYEDGAFSAAGPTIYTTPAAPSNVTAQKVGSDIVVTWTDNSAWETGFEVECKIGSTWNTTPLATVTGTTYTHVAPSSTSAYAYRIRAVTTSPALKSAYSTVSNDVLTIAAPLAPTALTPSVSNQAVGVPLSWQHNPTDTTAQTKYEVQWRASGASTWASLGQVASATSTALVPAGTWASGSDIEWQVRTWGAFTDPSPWSATKITAMRAAPTVAITTPGATFNSSALTAAWTFTDTAGQQSSAKVELLDSSNAVLATTTASGTALTSAVPYMLANGGSYSLRVTSTSSTGLSASVTKAFTVSYAPPPTPTAEAAFDPDSAAAVIGWSVPTATGSQVAAVSVSVYRSVDGGPLELVESGLPLSSTIIDRTPPAGECTYVVRAVSALGTVADSAGALADCAGMDSLAINGGPGFGTVALAGPGATVDITEARDAALVQFLGRRKPVEFSGSSTLNTYSLSIPTYHSEDLWDSVRAIHAAGGQVIYRDKSGRRALCASGAPTLQGGGNVIRTITWVLTEIDE